MMMKMKKMDEKTRMKKLIIMKMKKELTMNASVALFSALQIEFIKIYNDQSGDSRREDGGGDSSSGYSCSSCNTWKTTQQNTSKRQ